VPSGPFTISRLAGVAGLLYFKQGRIQWALDLCRGLHSHSGRENEGVAAVCECNCSEAGPPAKSAGARLPGAWQATLRCLRGAAPGHS
jgi:hypothetical protein